MSTKKVFISYSHDSDEHRAQVLSLSVRLRKDGIATLLDQYVNGSPAGGWPRWMLDQLDAANSVLVICTETYYRRFRGHEVPGKGKGVDWEGALITQEIYDSHSRTLKFVPVLISGASSSWIPEPLRSATHYSLTSEAAYQSLCDFLLGQAGVEPGPVGSPKTKPRQRGEALTFDAPRPAQEFRADLSRIDKYAPAELIGRDDEKKLLSDAWTKVREGTSPRHHIVTFVALGGEGKTSLVAKWAAELAHQGWPRCDAAFAWSFYSQGASEQSVASSDLFLREALTFFGDTAMADSSRMGVDKAKRLAELVGERRALLILDGLEPLQYPPTSPLRGQLKDDGISALLKGLAVRSDGLCVVTTRYSVPDLTNHWQTTAPEVPLLRLTKEAGVALLKSLGVRKESGSQQDFERLVEDVKGHALTLNLIGTYLHDAHAGDIRRRDLMKFEEADPEVQGGHAFRVMDAYVRWIAPLGFRAWLRALLSKKEYELQREGRRAIAVLRLLGLFDRPASAACLAALKQAPIIPDLTEALVGMTEAQRNIAFTRLEEAKLLTVNRDSAGGLISLDAHPLLREYFAKQLRMQHPETWRAAHKRLYEHLCTTTPDKPKPTLEDLQPLYQAVAHACQAGLQQEACEKVYRDRILRGQDFYSTKKLGAFGSDLGSVACFFEQPWSRVSPALTESDQAWLLSQTAFRLRALGRLTEALEPMRAGLKMGVCAENWIEAARRASNLSELELTLGDVDGAVRDAEHSVNHADRSEDGSLRMAFRTTHAAALHQAGRIAEAEALFREAEKMQAQRQPAYPLLYSLPGFLYCDLLLAAPERAAWCALLSRRDEADSQLRSAAGETGVEDQSHPSLAVSQLESCRAVSERAGKMFEWRVPSDSLLTIALDHLTLGRTALYQAILEGSSLDPCRASIQEAVNGLRRSGSQHHVPHGLLTRALLRFLTGPRTGPQSAQEDLDEAQEIAERGPMRLHLADIHLHRARLFRDKSELAKARALIEQCGYGRRKGELEDAEEAAKGW